LQGLQDAPIGTKYWIFIPAVHYKNMSPCPRTVLHLMCWVVLIIFCMSAGCSSTPVSPVTTTPPASAGAVNSVAIKNFAFDPPVLTVKAGTAVTWVNNDAATHTIVSDTGSPQSFSSDSLSTGASYAFTFSRPGTYTYHCSIHPSMTGTITVQ
jgi:plastocyanin